MSTGLVKLETRVYRGYHAEYNPDLVPAILAHRRDSPVVVFDLLCKLKTFPAYYSTVSWEDLAGLLASVLQTDDAHLQLRRIDKLMHEWHENMHKTYARVVQLQQALKRVKAQPVWVMARTLALGLENDLGAMARQRQRQVSLAGRDAWETLVISHIRDKAKRDDLQRLWCMCGTRFSLVEQEQEQEGGEGGENLPDAEAEESYDRWMWWAGVRLWVALDEDVVHFASPFDQSSERFSDLANAPVNTDIVQGQLAINRVVGGMVETLGSSSSSSPSPTPQSEAPLAADDVVKQTSTGWRGGRQTLLVGDWFNYRAVLQTLANVPPSEDIVEQIRLFREAQEAGTRAVCVVNEASYVVWALHRSMYRTEDHAALGNTASHGLHHLLTFLYSIDMCRWGWRVLFPQSVMHQHMHLSGYLHWITRDVTAGNMAWRDAWRALTTAIRYASRCVSDVTVSQGDIRTCLQVLNTSWIEPSRRKRSRSGPDPVSTLKQFLDEFAVEDSQPHGASRTVANVICSVSEFVSDVCDLIHAHRPERDDFGETLVPSVAVDAGEWVCNVVDVLRDHAGKPCEIEQEEEVGDEEEEEEAVEAVQVETQPQEVSQAAEDAPEINVETVVEDLVTAVNDNNEIVVMPKAEYESVLSAVEEELEEEQEQEEGEEGEELAVEDAVDAEIEELLASTVDGDGVDVDNMTQHEYRQALVELSQPRVLSDRARAEMDVLLRHACLQQVAREVKKQRLFSHTISVVADMVLQSARVALGAGAAGATDEVDAARVCGWLVDLVHSASGAREGAVEQLQEWASSSVDDVVDGLVRATVQTAAHARVCPENLRRHMASQLAWAWRTVEPLVASPAIPLHISALAVCVNSKASAGKGKEKKKQPALSKSTHSLVPTMLATMQGASYMLPILLSLMASTTWNRVFSLKSKHHGLFMDVSATMRIDSTLVDNATAGTASAEPGARTVFAAVQTLVKTKVWKDGWFASVACNGLMETVLDAMGDDVTARAYGVVIAFMANARMAVRDQATVLGWLKETTDEPTRRSIAADVQSAIPVPLRGPQLLEDVITQPRPVLAL